MARATGCLQIKSIVEICYDAGLQRRLVHAVFEYASVDQI
jgi:hypothetical protein